jgi:hypothetical protein
VAFTPKPFAFARNDQGAEQGSGKKSVIADEEGRQQAHGESTIRSSEENRAHQRQGRPFRGTKKAVRKSAQSAQAVSLSE